MDFFKSLHEQNGGPNCCRCGQPTTLATVLLAAALAGIWTGIRDEMQVRKIERERRQAAEDH